MGLFDFSGFGRQVADLKNTVADLDAKITDTNAEITRLRTAPPSRDDVKVAVDLAIGARALQGHKLISAGLRPLANKPMRLADPDGVGQIAILGASSPGAEPTAFTLESCITALLGDQIKAAVNKLVDGLEWPDAGPPVAERRALIEKAEHRLAQLTAERETMRRQAADAGLLI